MSFLVFIIYLKRIRETFHESNDINADFPELSSSFLGTPKHKIYSGTRNVFPRVFVCMLMKKEKPTTVRLTKDVLKSLKDEAKKRDVSLAHVIREKIRAGKTALAPPDLTH